MSTLTLTQFDLNQIIIEETRRLLEGKDFIKRSTRSVVSEVSDRYDRTPPKTTFDIYKDTPPDKTPDILLDVLQTTLGFAGLFQGPTELADLMNAAISYKRGLCFEAILDIISALPIGGAISGATLGAYRTIKLTAKTGKLSFILKSYLKMVGNFLKKKNQILASMEQVKDFLRATVGAISPILKRGEIHKDIFLKKYSVRSVSRGGRSDYAIPYGDLPETVKEKIVQRVSDLGPVDPPKMRQRRVKMDKIEQEERSNFVNKIFDDMEKDLGIADDKTKSAWLASGKEADKRLSKSSGLFSAYDSKEALERDVEILFGFKSNTLVGRTAQSLGGSERLETSLQFIRNWARQAVPAVNFLFYKALPLLGNLISGMVDQASFLARSGMKAVELVGIINNALNEAFCTLTTAPLEEAGPAIEARAKELVGALAGTTPPEDDTKGMNDFVGPLPEPTEDGTEGEITRTPDGTL